MKLEIVSLYGDAPVQALGYINGYPFYFRARADRWTFAVASVREHSFDLAIAATAECGQGLLLSKRFRDTTALSEEKARAIIRRAARAALAFME